MSKILIVEDDPSLRGVIRFVLERAGYIVSEAANGFAAFDAMDGAIHDLVIADLTMPVMDGVELIDRIRSSPKTASVPVILVTGVLDDRRAIQAADAVVAKPFEPNDLLATIVRLLESRRR